MRINYATYGYRKTKTLFLDDITPEILEHFEHTHKDTFKCKKRYKAQDASWTLFLNVRLKCVYGISGDYWFGSAPSYMSNRFGGNIRAANKVYSEFLQDIGVQ